MVSKWVVTPVYPIYKLVITHLLIIDPNFQRDIQVGLSLCRMTWQGPRLDCYFQGSGNFWSFPTDRRKKTMGKQLDLLTNYDHWQMNIAEKIHHLFTLILPEQSHQVSFQISKLNHKQCNRQAAHLFLQTRIWVGFLARGLVCKRCWIRLAVNRILNFGFRV